MYNITFEHILTSPVNETEELDLENILSSEYSKFCSVFYPHCRRSRQNNETVVDCTLKMIGKPIMHVERLPKYGTYLLETWSTKNKRWSRKRWLMSNAISSVLFEYDYEEYIGIKVRSVFCRSAVFKMEVVETIEICYVLLLYNMYSM